ncbi:hypothetical protein GCM10011506_34940 [Marivirga lumbricoides]|uniref:FAS1 domain-containing protein n=1 Tax=Marivirga lumbricoides TaxID=1046115 RepID=A0ABQ1MTK9_9BACT|nr:hypothetical protein GCM10011506_34940 [Marivirga lumbricoides]
MKKNNLFLKLSSTLMAVVFLAMSSVMLSSCDDEDEGGDPAPDSTILEIVASSENHTQLEAFVTANSNLVSVLQGNNLTLFAPNDAAFEKLRVILGVESLDQVNPNVISAVLAYHVHTEGVLRRADLVAGTSFSTLQGEENEITAEGNVKEGGSDQEVEFVGDEILATNGVVHVVETILVPPTIFATIGANLGKVSQTILLSSNFSTLAAAIYKADTYAATDDEVTPLTEILANGELDLTVFAPVNEVFANAEPAITLDTYTAEQWYGLIANHVLLTTKLKADLEVGIGNPTAAEGVITLLPSGGLDSDGVEGAEAQFITGASDIVSDNGVVHAIAGILKPAATGRYAIDTNFTVLRNLAK